MVRRTKYTMRDVARLAKVSTATVSAVINRNVPVSALRTKRVSDAMAALDYHPDEIARSLKKGRTNAIGVIVPDITNTFYPEVIQGVEEAARQRGYAVLLCDSSENPENEREHLSTLFSRRVDGVLLACCADSTSQDAIARQRYPVVFVDRIPFANAENSVSTDNLHAGYIAARHLLGLGHQNIAMVVGDLGLSPHRDRLEGFRKAMQEANLPIRDEFLISGPLQVADGYAAGVQVFNLKVQPTAIMVSNNKLLLGLLQAIDERGVAIPTQMSVLGFDDYPWNKYFNPSLTAVAQATYEMGRRSLELLLQIIEREKGATVEKSIRLKAELRIRNSTTQPPRMPAARAGS
jgi:LacI family transcriptional regulator, galactose operon repressor